MNFNADEPSSHAVAVFALMEAPAGAMERYWRLAVQTLEYQKRLKAAGIFNYPTWIGVDEAVRVSRYLANQIPEEHHDQFLFARWQDWGDEFASIYQASPKWRLKEMISGVSGTHALLSWPSRWEQEIWKWAMSDDPKPVCPFDDRRNLFDPGFRQRLRALIAETDGFLYRCEETGEIVFVQSADLDKIWRHLHHLAEIDRNKLFGFFCDATRPNFTMRAPTDEEERAMATIRRRAAEQRGWRARLTRHFLRLRR